MYLYVNPSGERHVLCKTFKQVLKTMKNAKDNVWYKYTVLDSDSIGSYDMLISRITETVSKKQFVKARFVHNPKNLTKTRDVSGESLFGLFGLIPNVLPNTINEKSFDALTLLLDSLLVNGYLPMDADIPNSVLDDYESLTATLDDFFRPTEIRKDFSISKQKEDEIFTSGLSKKDTLSVDSFRPSPFIMAEVKTYSSPFSPHP